MTEALRIRLRAAGPLLWISLLGGLAVAQQPDSVLFRRHALAERYVYPYTAEEIDTALLSDSALADTSRGHAYLIQMVTLSYDEKVALQGTDILLESGYPSSDCLAWRISFDGPLLYARYRLSILLPNLYNVEPLLPLDKVSSDFYSSYVMVQGCTLDTVAGLHYLNLDFWGEVPQTVQDSITAAYIDSVHGPFNSCATAPLDTILKLSTLPEVARISPCDICFSAARHPELPQSKPAPSRGASNGGRPCDLRGRVYNAREPHGTGLLIQAVDGSIMLSGFCGRPNRER